MDPFVKMQAFPSLVGRLGRPVELIVRSWTRCDFPSFPVGLIGFGKVAPSQDAIVGNEGFFQDSLPNMVILLMVTDDCIVEGGGP